MSGESILHITHLYTTSQNGSLNELKISIQLAKTTETFLTHWSQGDFDKILDE